MAKNQNIKKTPTKATKPEPKKTPPPEDKGGRAKKIAVGVSITAVIILALILAFQVSGTSKDKNNPNGSHGGSSVAGAVVAGGVTNNAFLQHNSIYVPPSRTSRTITATPSWSGLMELDPSKMHFDVLGAENCQVLIRVNRDVDDLYVKAVEEGHHVAYHADTYGNKIGSPLTDLPGTTRKLEFMALRGKRLVDVDLQEW